MSKISNIISKQVVSLYEANLVGTIVNVFFDEKLCKLKGLIVVDDENEKEYELSLKDVFSMSKDAFVIKNVSKLKEVILQEDFNNPINKVCISINGEILGKIIDVEIDNGVVENIILENGKQLSSSMVVACENVVIVNDTNNSVKRSGFAPKMKKINTDNIIVKIQQSNVEDEKKQVQLIPPRFVAKSMLGQVSLKTVKGLNNEIIVKKGELITSAIIEKARLHNVLNLLV